MAQTIQYGRCTNKARCSLALNRENVFVPLDGRCPECGLPLEVDSMARRRLKLIPLVLVLAALGAGGYYAKKKFIDPGHPAAQTSATKGARGDQEPADTPPPGDAGAQADNSGAPPAAGGAVDRPKFDLEDDANAKARRDVLARIGLMPHLTEAQKSKLTTSVDRARGMGCIFIIPFEAGKKTLGPKESDILVNGFQSASIQKLMEDPTLVFVILGYADNTGDAQQNDKASIDRAQSVLNTMRDRAGVQNVMYSVGMGGSSLFDKKSAAKNRLVEIWAVYP
jgi:outer membrane protein OmpA-like peptidoglycan-associated protein